MLKLAQIGLGLSSPGGVHFGERTWLALYLPNRARSVVFDVGGHSGEFSAAVLKVQPDAQIFVFEPNPTVFAGLERRFQQQNIFLDSHGLSDRCGDGILYDFVGQSKNVNEQKTIQGSSFASLHEALFTDYFKRDYRPVPIETTTVDEVIAKFSIERIDLLKIDAEGWELKVLEGARKTIAEGKISAIQFEFGFRNIYSRALFGDYVHLLKDYRLHRLLGHGLLPLGPYDPRRDENMSCLQTIVALRADLRVGA